MSLRNTTPQSKDVTQGTYSDLVFAAEERQDAIFTSGVET